MKPLWIEAKDAPYGEPRCVPIPVCRSRFDAGLPVGLPLDLIEALTDANKHALSASNRALKHALTIR